VTDDEHLAVEVAQFLQHVHDIADLLAERMGSLPASEAEALLKFKHPDHFNVLGASHWRGRIYGGDEIGVRIGRDVIYHGIFGTGLFQTIYRKSASVTAMMLMSVEWHLLGPRASLPERSPSTD